MTGPSNLPTLLKQLGPHIWFSFLSIPSIPLSTTKRFFNMAPTSFKLNTGADIPAVGLGMPLPPTLQLLN